MLRVGKTQAGQGAARIARWPLAALVVALLWALAPVPSAGAAPGNVYVADVKADTIWKVPPGGGPPTALSSSPMFVDPYGMTLGPDGFLYVADFGAGKVFRVNRNTGATKVVSDFGVALPVDVAFDARGRLLVVEYELSDLFVVNRSTGAHTPFFDGHTGSYNSLAPRRNGALFIGDEGDDLVHLLSPTGVLSTVLGPNPNLDGPDGILLSPDERYLYVGSYSVPRIFRYNVRTGKFVKFELGHLPNSLAMLPNGRLLYSDGDTGAVMSVSRTGGASRIFSSGGGIDVTRDIVVEPRRCAGRWPTIVGTNRRDVIRGSRFRDVISTLGGNDIVYGLAGNDIVCLGNGRDRAYGGRGRDTLLGQGGPDSLFGQAGPDLLKGHRGRDLLVGGPRRDRCFGGPGRDRRRRC